MTMDTPGTGTMTGNTGRDPLAMPRDTAAGSAGRDSLTGTTGNMQTGRDPLVDRAANSAHQAVDRVAAKVAPAVERVRAAAQGSADTLQTKISDLDTMRAEWTESCREYVRERPMTALGVAVLAGFLLSRWMRTS